MQIRFCFTNDLFPKGKEQQILSVESFIQISIRILSKPNVLNNCIKEIVMQENALGKFLAKLLDQMWQSFLKNSQKLLIAQRNSQ